MLLPALLFLVVFTIAPTIVTIIDSFWFTPHGAKAATFAGMAQYEALLADPIFWQALRNNLLYAAVTVPVSIILALAMALWTNGRIKGRAFMRLAFFLPTMLPMIGAANIWIYFYTADYGLIDQIGHLFGAGSHNWLGNPHTALGALMVVAIWKEAGFFMVFYLAALQQIPPSLIEAAQLEGANAWQTFWRVTLPLLMPTTLFVGVNALINSFRVVDQVISMTGGGPDNATSLLIFYVYQTAFSFWDTYYGATISTVLLLGLGLLSFLQFALFGRRVHYR
ncbi:MAG: sugar ABC transporter permease [Hyphomicrobiales bacterium]|nr:sugar ABC transporter permease [Hyphomicrobiales bacterium]